MATRTHQSPPSEKGDNATPLLHPDVRLTLDVLVAARRETRAQKAAKPESSAA